jgi:hypothetical protein
MPFSRMILYVTFNRVTYGTIKLIKRKLSITKLSRKTFIRMTLKQNQVPHSDGSYSANAISIIMLSKNLSGVGRALM